MAQPTIDAPRTRGHKKKERTRARLIDAAIDVIAANGEAFSVGDVTAHAGVSHGTFYNYFDDRDALIDAVAPEVLTAFAVESAAIVPEGDPALRFATISALALRQAAVAPHRIRVVLRLVALQRTVLEAPVLDHLRTDLAAGNTSGRFKVGADDAAIDVVVGGLLLAARRILDGPVAQDYVQSVVAQLLRSLGVQDVEASELAQQAVTLAGSVAAIEP